VAIDKTFATTHFMNLNKDNWRKVKIGEVCEKVKTVDIRKQTGKFNYVDIGSVNSELNRVNDVSEVDWTQASSRARQIIRINDTLFSTVRVNLLKIAFIKNEILNGIASTGFTVIRAKNNLIDSRFLFYSVLSPEFIHNLVLLQAGTAYPAVSDKIVFSQNIPLPPLEEQKTIADLFQSTDAAIEHADEQEKNLRTLAKRLIDGLINEQPTFGNLLESQKLSKVKFADVTECIEQHEKQPSEKGLTLFIGLENIEPENFRVSTWGNIADGTTFTKTFASGDVLFGKRRSYLKKVAIAEFDGICSSDILVFKAKENKMLAKLLPFYVASEAFIQYAVNTSAGSLSPRTKWRDLAKFEVCIPDLEIQSKILDVLQQIQTTIEQIREQKQTLKNLKYKLLNEILG
jgi:restriction endonuclease S subunit